MNGIEWVVDAQGCDAESLRDLELLRRLFDTLILDLRLRPVGATQWHQFPGSGGITGLCLLSESHLACHTLPERVLLRATRRVELSVAPRGDVLGHYRADSRRREILQRGRNGRIGKRRTGPMTQPTANCPNCGAKITFRWSASVQTVCEYCKSILVRTDVDLE